jgi:holo-[acyl-carrier protein] synthase
MIAGLGIDVIRVDRFEKAEARPGEGLADEVLTAAEIAYCRGKARPAPFVAARFAAKEALLKALGTGRRGRISWRDIEVVSDEMGKPSFVLGGEVKEVVERLGVRAIHLSMTHTNETAAAVVVLEA